MSNFTIFSHFALIPLEYSDLIGFAYVSGNRLPSWNFSFNTSNFVHIFCWADLSALLFAFQPSLLCHSRVPHRVRCRAPSAGDTQGHTQTPPAHTTNKSLSTGLVQPALTVTHRAAQQLQPGPLAAKCPSLNPSWGPKAKDELQWTARSNADQRPSADSPLLFMKAHSCTWCPPVQSVLTMGQSRKHF